MNHFKSLLISYLLISLSLMLYAQKTHSLPEGYERISSMDDALQDPLAVEYLDLSRAKLKKVPTEISQLQNLKVLVLSKNKIEVIPDNILSLQNLEYIDLSSNKLIRLPDSMHKLEKLHTLILRRNPLGYLPESICQLPFLRHLDIFSTDIAYLPECIGERSSSLKSLNVRYTPIMQKEMERIFAALPNTRIYYSAGCKCDQ